MADSSEPAFLFLYRKEAVAPVDYLSTFATAPYYYEQSFSAYSTNILAVINSLMERAV